MDAGADAVVGHHPHVLQGVEIHAGVPIIYSLGNFVFDLQPYFFDAATSLTAIANLRFVDGAVRHLELVPMHLGSDGRPYRLQPGTDEHDTIVRDVTDLSARLGTRFTGGAGTLVLALD